MIENILKLKHSGFSIKKISEELNIPQHKVRNTIYRNKDYKPKSNTKGHSKTD